MYRNNTPSFSVKSSHRLVNQQPEMEESEEPVSYYSSNSRAPAKPTKGYVDHDNNNRKGSNKGMSIHTTDVSAEDFY